MDRCKHGLAVTACALCAKPELVRAAPPRAKRSAAGGVSEVYRGFTIYYTPPPERVWSFRRQPDAPLESHRSAFQARRAINELLDGSSPSMPRRGYRPGTEPASIRTTPSIRATPSSRAAPVAEVALSPRRGATAPPAVPIQGLLDGDGTHELVVILPKSRRSVLIRAVTRSEQRFIGDLPANFRTVPNKVAVDYRGKALYPEFAIIRRLQEQGWSALWRKNWQGAAFWTDIGVSGQPASRLVELFEQVQILVGRGGAWDILAWKGDETLFIESKQKGADRLTANQLGWLEAALQLGVDPDCFVVYEYRA